MFGIPRASITSRPKESKSDLLSENRTLTWNQAWTFAPRKEQTRTQSIPPLSPPSKNKKIRGFVEILLLSGGRVSGQNMELWCGEHSLLQLPPALLSSLLTPQKSISHDMPQ